MGGDVASRTSHAPAALPAEIGAWLASAPRALAGAAAARDWDATTRSAALAAFDTVSNLLTVARARVVTAERDAGTWALRGDRDLAGFLGRVSRQGLGAGRAAVGQASTLESMPAVADALVDGPVTAKHVEQITRATQASPALAAELVTPEGQARVVEMARRLDGSHFGTALRQMSAAMDPASRQREHEEQRAARFLNVAHAPGGTQITALLDSVAGYEFAKAIDALNPRPTKDDDRTAAQRRADALMAMVRRTATDKSTTPGAVAPVQAVITFTQEAWAALRGAREGRGDRGAGERTAGERGVGDRRAEAPGVRNENRVPSKGSTADVVASLRKVPAVTDEDGRAWPAGEIARALCDCALTRAVVEGPALALDLGRGDRYFRTQHWLALFASGQTTCAWPGCSMPLRYSELHHMRWWDRDGGPTTMANCAPECRYHHQYIHDRDISVTRRSDGTYEHRDRHGRLIGVPGETAETADGARTSLVMAPLVAVASATAPPVTVTPVTTAPPMTVAPGAVPPTTIPSVMAPSVTAPSMTARSASAAVSPTSLATPVLWGPP